MVNLTRDDLAQWRNNPVTKEYFNALRQKQIDLARYMAAGGTLTSPGLEGNDAPTEEKTAKTVGRIAGLEDALTVELATEEDE